MIAAFTAPAATPHKQLHNEEIHLCIDDEEIIKKMMIIVYLHNE
jgi:hypothetical protein